ncbi:hypothetical protein [Sphingomonas sp. C3-2]|uniref:hypothetical protein n=1 Tax=Sphingomonas sp. C3-2 TaxID=3062169 RepID=UPI00294B1D1D|nr:hypothetical protein [Sphingomonas sp. C3-2]WOK37017.1 hypothetical protein QYC26_02145 [Sphingomonas sp. C3-2]
MVTSTPGHIVHFDTHASPAPTSMEQMRDKGRSYFDSTVTAAQEHPWAAAAIGAGVVATLAATAYGATRLARHYSHAESDDIARTPFMDDVSGDDLEESIPSAHSSVM